MKNLNPVLLIDGYKVDHRRQYPEGTQTVYSNWTARGSREEEVDEVVFFGLQYFIQRYLIEEFDNNFFSLPRHEVTERYQAFIDGYLGPNAIGTDHIGALHDLGYLPLEFRALPEGTRVPLRVPMLTVHNTHPDFGWLTNYVETLMSNILWMPCTSATTAWRYRKDLDAAAAATGGPAEFVAFQGHDFSFRGMAGVESAILSGMGHLLSFVGTDTIPAIEAIGHYYPGNGDTLIGCSVAATEHSVMCAGGEESERETFQRLLNLYPEGIVSVVSDTWDFWNVLTVILPELKDEIMARNGKLVIRPDSGDPADILCGNPKAEPGTPEFKGAVQLLHEIFGGTETEKGYILLDEHIGLIYGDSITVDRERDIVERLAAKGYASTNVVFGIGSYTYQYVTRDTYYFAMKATAVQIDGTWKAISKAPKTDDGKKNSARGKVAVIKPKGKLMLIDGVDEVTETVTSLLKPVWRDGNFIRTQSFEDVRRVLQEG